MKIAGQEDVVVNDVQSHLYSAIDRAVGRATRAATKRVTRLRDKAKRFKSRVQKIGGKHRDRYLKEDYDEYFDDYEYI